MAYDKNFLSGNTTMLVLKLLEEKDRYGYEIIETLEQNSNHTFEMKAGTLYPILHGLEEKEMLTSYEECADTGRKRKYYSITKKGKKLLEKQKLEWDKYYHAVNKVMGVTSHGTVSFN